MPDYFARRADGSAVVADCRPVERRGPGDLAKFEATGRVCARLGWEYRLVGGVEPILAGNLRWLAGYRHPRYDRRQVAQLLAEVFATSFGLMDGAARVGDPIAVLPVLLHL
ncbi:TnsA-like heteromeric transposase endonuclease subunit [Mycobacterium sp.]|uniref:TnsA-like heteromeric transposase endonuclease subunit n=1 Tax=Mycobacterium sp. TaxID=1785 RepID=UPI003F9DFFE3